VLDAFPPGHVVSQSPGAGTPAPAGARVLIAVRKP
jgi:beta-lactam-binding protein with PASTA domain